MLPGNGNEFKSFPDLNIALPFECRTNRAVLDGSTAARSMSGVVSQAKFLRGKIAHVRVVERRFPMRRIMRRISFLMFVVFAWFASAPWLQAQGEFTSFDAGLTK
jgi:hypothetical protein